MRAPVLLAAAVAATALASVPVAAAPTASARAYAEASTAVIGSDGARYVVSVQGVAAGPAQAGLVSVVVKRCARTCGDVVLDARLAVPDNAVAVALDESTASAAAALGGPLSVTWRGGALPGLAGLQVWDTAPTVRTGSQRLATATLSLFGLRCATTSAVIGHAVVASGADLTTPRSATVPAALRPRGDRAPRCARA